MTTENFQNSSNATPHPTGCKKYSPIPLVHELATVYLILHNAIRDFPKLEKYSLGEIIEKTLLDCTKQTFLATVIPPGAQKFQAIATASALFDTLKLHVHIAVEIFCLSKETQIKLIPHFGEIGRMLGGWLGEAKKIVKDNPQKLF